jgi:hypothetical protein
LAPVGWFLTVDRQEQYPWRFSAVRNFFLVSGSVSTCWCHWYSKSFKKIFQTWEEAQVIRFFTWNTHMYGTYETETKGRLLSRGLHPELKAVSRIRSPD